MIEPVPVMKIQVITRSGVKIKSESLSNITNDSNATTPAPTQVK
jgi:hypothetical protein